MRQGTAGGGSQASGVEAPQELKRMSEALGAMALVCRWLVRDRTRRMAPLDAVRQELVETREKLAVATSTRDVIVAERAAYDRELRRLVRRCDKLAAAQERASMERGEAIRERERALRDLRRAQAALTNPRSGRQDARIQRSAAASGEHSGVESGREALPAHVVRAILGPRGMAIAALILAIAVLLIVLTTQ
jgi:septal ring factor EnvC (AmiA/AmiB activator)